MKHPVEAFQHLRAALDKTEAQTRPMPDRAHALTLKLQQREQQSQSTHLSTLEKTQTWLQVLQDEEKQLALVNQKTLQSLEQYQQRVGQSAHSIENELESAQDETNALTNINAGGLFRQQERLKALHETEEGADVDRASRLAAYSNGLSAEDERLSDVIARMGQANQTLARAFGIDSNLERSRHELQAQAFNQQAIQAAARGHLHTARAVLEIAVGLAPHLTQLWVNLGQACLELQDVPAAARACQQAQQLEPDASIVQLLRGRLALMQAQPERAIELLEPGLAALEAGADEIALRLSLAEAYYRAGHPQRAIAQWQRVCELDPFNRTALTWRSWVEA